MRRVLFRSPNKARIKKESIKKEIIKPEPRSPSIQPDAYPPAPYDDGEDPDDITFTGTYSVVCPTITEMFPEFGSRDLQFDLLLDERRSVWWASFSWWGLGRRHPDGPWADIRDARYTVLARMAAPRSGHGQIDVWEEVHGLHDFLCRHEDPGGV